MHRTTPFFNNSKSGQQCCHMFTSQRNHIHNIKTRGRLQDNKHKQLRESMRANDKPPRARAAVFSIKLKYNLILFDCYPLPLAVIRAEFTLPTIVRLHWKQCVFKTQRAVKCRKTSCMAMSAWRRGMHDGVFEGGAAYHSQPVA